MEVNATTTAAGGAPTPAVGDPFRVFYAQFGETLCGRPVSEVVVENGRRCQYFEHLALEEGDDGRPRLKPLGRAWFEQRANQAAATEWAPPRPQVVDVRADLPRHATKTYPLRPLEDIRYLVVHHTGAPGDIAVRAIADEHVRVNDWPGIGYHFVIDPTGVIYQTQDLTTVSYHARQFNPAAAGIALMGDLTVALPTVEQMEALATLVARVLADLGLPASSVRGHREMVATPCPGDTFLSVWKPRLLRDVAAKLSPQAAAIPVASPALPAATPAAEELPAPAEEPPAAGRAGRLPATEPDGAQAMEPPERAPSGPADPGPSQPQDPAGAPGDPRGQ
jgi:hypothetical protein